MQLSAIRTAVQRGVATRSGGSSLLRMPPARYARSARPSRTPVRTSAQAESAVGQKTGGKKRTRIQDLLRAKVTEALGWADEAPEQVTTVTPEDTKLCIHYATWAWASYEVDVNTALDTLTYEASIKQKLIPSSLVILSGSSKLTDKRALFNNFVTDTQALIGLQEDGKGGVELVVAFRGSEPKASDWLTDFLVDMDPASGLVPGLDPKMQLHSGFMASANDFLTDQTTLVYGPRDAKDLDKRAFEKQEDGEELFDKERSIVNGNMNTVKTLKQLGERLAKQYNKRISKVVVCGHSLGGALATLTSYWCRKVGWPDVPVEYYSYGAPRVANREFADEWNKTVIHSQSNAKAFRVVHRLDAVPAIPHVDLPIPIGGGDLNFARYFHVDCGVLLLQPGLDSMIGNQGNPKRWPVLAVDPTNGFQAQRRGRPYNLNNTSDDDHRLYNVIDSPRSEEGYIAALKDALKNYTGKYQPLSG